MPRVSRSRLVPAAPDEIWRLVSDPHSLPRWWPRTTRVEAVRELGRGRRSRWTKVLLTRRGSVVRADYRCVSSVERERLIWEQELENTPFEKLLLSNRLSVSLLPEGAGTKVTLEAEQKMRGLSRLGSPMAARAARGTLSEALAAIDRSVTEAPAEPTVMEAPAEPDDGAAR